MTDPKRGIWRLTVTEGFCASHCLRGYEGRARTCTATISASRPWWKGSGSIRRSNI